MQYAPRTRGSLITYHNRHPSLDRDAKELYKRQNLTKGSRGGQDASFPSEAGPANSHPSRPVKRLHSLDGSSKATSPKRPRCSDPGASGARHPSPSPSHLSPTASVTALGASTSQAVPASGAYCQAQPKKFDTKDWKIAMEFVASRDPPEDPIENVLSWKTLAKKVRFDVNFSGSL